MRKVDVAKNSKSNAELVLNYLNKFGQLLDFEISSGTGLPLASVHDSLNELASKGEISRCQITQYVNGKIIEGIQCRVSGYAPPPAPGRKPGSIISS